MRKLIAGFAVSLDGYIEGPNGEYDWITSDQEQYKELAEFWKRMDAMFYGRKTYEVCLAMQPGSHKKNPFAHMKHYVFSQSLDKAADGYILVKGNLEKEVTKIRNEPGKEIAVFGGAALFSSLINLDMIDELVLAVCPVRLGEGQPQFARVRESKNYRLKKVKTYTSGLVSLTYEK